MTVYELIKALNARGISLGLGTQADNLVVNDPGRRLEADLLKELKAHKAALLEYVRKAQARAHPDGPATAPEKAYYEASAEQKRIFLLHQLDGNNVHYNIFEAFEIRGKLERVAVERAFGQLIGRHEALRTRFEVRNEAVVQCVEETVAFALQYREADSREEAVRLCAAFPRPFDLGQAPLLRGGLIRIAEAHFFLLFDLHHVIADGTSVRILAEDFYRLYRGETLPPPGIAYKDYSVWQQRRKQEGRLEASRRYWLDQLRPPLAVTGFPADFNRPAVQQFRGAAVRFALDEAQTAGLQALAARTRSTPYAILFACLNVLLYKYTGQQDLLVGTVSDGRHRADLQQLVGMLAATLVLRSRVSGDMPFSALLEGVKAGLVDAVAHQAYSLEDVLADLHYRHDPSRHTIFGVMFVFDNHDPAGRYQTDGFTATPLPHEPGTAKFDLTFNARQTDCNVLFELRYNTDLFRRTTVERIAAHYVRIVEAVVAGADRCIGHLPLLSPAEEASLAVQSNAAIGQTYPRHAFIHRLFEQQALRQPARVALRYAGGEMSYGELNGKANQLAGYLRQRGVGPETVVAFLAYRSPESIVCILAILKAGGIYLPVDPAYPPDRQRLMVEQTHCRHLLVMQASDQFSAPGPLQVIHFHEAWSAVADGAGPEATPREEDTDSRRTAYVLFTSGTTGVPKGCMVSHENVIQLLRNERMPFRFDHSDVWLLAHSLCFDFSVWEMYGALLHGGTLVIPPLDDVRDPRSRLAWIRTHRVTVLNQTPKAFYNLMEEAVTGRFGLDEHLRYVIFGGDKLNLTNLLPWIGQYPPDRIRLINMYGITETTVHVTFYPVSETDIAGGKTASIIGRPLPETSVYVYDADLNLCPVGVAGEMYIGGRGVCNGYMHQPGLTREKFIPDPRRAGQFLYRSGDVGAWQEDGNLAYLGRNDSQLKVRGFRIEPAEVEAALVRHPAVQRAVVLSREDHNGDRVLCAYFTAREAVDTNQLRDGLGGALPEHMIPGYLIQVPEIPLTANGKLDAEALPAPSPAPAPAPVLPRNPRQRDMAALWGEALHVAPPGITDGYFSLGGDSIKAIRLLSRVNARFGSDLRIGDLYANDTVEKLTALLETRGVPAGPSRPDETGAAFSVFKEEARRRGIYPDAEDIYPVSDVQQGMIFHSLKDSTNLVYHVQAVKVHRIPDFDPEVLRRALALLIARHEMLRTTFDFDHFAEPVQVVHREGVLDFEHLDLQPLDRDAQRNRIREMIGQDAGAAFNLAQLPLLRFKTVALGDDLVAFIRTVHHAVLDGWSDASFITELYATYTQLRQAPDFIPPKLRSNYKRYVAGERREKQNPAAIAFWKAELEGYKRYELPSRGQANPGRGSRKKHFFDFGSPFRRELEQWGARHQHSFNTICFAAYAYALHMFNYEAELVVGVVAHGRPVHEDGDKVLGCFLNTLPVRVHFPPERNWRAYVGAVEEKLRAVARHGQLSLFEITRILGERASAGNRIVDTLYNYNDYHQLEGVAGVGGEREVSELLEVGSQARENGNTLCDLTIRATLGAFEVILLHDESVLDERDAARLCSFFRQALEHILRSPGEPMRKQSLLPEAERRQLLAQFNATAAAYPRERTLADLFEARVAANPRGVALLTDDTRVSYEALNQAADALAARLAAAGVGPGDVAGIMCNRSVEMMAGLLGILKAGAAYLPLDPVHPEARHRYVCSHAAPKVLLVQDPFRQQAASLGVPLLGLTEAAEAGPDDPPRFAARALPHHLCYILFTSGSTGNPKGVMIEHHAVVNRLHWMQKAYPIGKSDVVMQKTNLSFDVSVWELFWPLIEGATLCLLAPGGETDPSAVARTVRRAGVTVMHFVPSMLNLFLDYAGQPERDAQPDRLRYVFASGEELKPATVQRFRRLFAPRGTHLVNLYGPTEATVDVTYFNCGAETESAAVIPIGRPIDNTQLYILDRNRELLPVGVAGELYISGAGLARGYVGNASRTDERFVPNPFDPPRKMYRTGDLARWQADGQVVFLGRNDFQVKIRGFRIELEEIENNLLQYPGIRAAVVVPRGAGGEDQMLCAYFTAPEAVAPAGLKAFLAAHLPPYMVPGAFVQLAALPLLPNGKLDRAGLPEPAMSGPGERRAPASPHEEILLGIWASVLQLPEDQISTHDDFFALGGHSVRAMQAVLRLQQAFGIRFELSGLFAHPTIRGLAAAVAAGPSRRPAAIPRTPGPGHYRLSSAQKRLLVAQAMHSGSTAYNMPFFALLRGRTDFDQVSAAFGQLLARHESLRTSFYAGEGGPVQQVHEAGDFALAYRQAAEADVAGIMAGFVRPFDLGQAPLIRAGLVSLAPDRALLMVDIHHLVCDGLSYRIVLEDLAASLAGKKAADLPVQFKDYAEWLNGEAHRLAVQSQRTFWLEEFGRPWVAAALSPDFPRPADPAPRGDRLKAVLAPAQVAGAKNLGRQTHTTLFMVFFAVYNLVLSKYDDQETVVAGTPLNGRNHPDLERVVGLFATVLPVKLRVDAQASFLSFLASVRQKLLCVFDNQDYPMEELVDELGLERVPGRNPLFDTVFMLEHQGGSQIVPAAGFTIEPYPFAGTAPKFDLVFALSESGTGFEITLEYNGSLFRRETMERLLAHYCNALDSVLEDPHAPMGAITLLSAAEQAQLLNFSQQDIDS